MPVVYGVKPLLCEEGYCEHEVHHGKHDENRSAIPARYCQSQRGYRNDGPEVSYGIGNA